MLTMHNIIITAELNKKMHDNSYVHLAVETIHHCTMWGRRGRKQCHIQYSIHSHFDNPPIHSSIHSFIHGRRNSAMASASVCCTIRGAVGLFESLAISSSLILATALRPDRTCLIGETQQIIVQMCEIKV